MEALRKERQRKDAEALKVKNNKGATLAAQKRGLAKLIVAEMIGESREDRKRTREKVAKIVASKPEVRGMSDRDRGRIRE